MALLILIAHLLLILGPGSLTRLPAGQWGDVRPVLVTLHSRDEAPAHRPATAASGSLARALLQARTSGQRQLNKAALASSPAQAPSSATAPVADTVAPADPPAASLPGATPEDLGWQATNLRIPPAQTLTYVLTGQSRGQHFQGEAELGWRHDGQQYEAHLRQRWASGLREMSSTGRLTAEGLTPDLFSDRREGRGELEAHFEPVVRPDLAASASEGARRAGGARVRFSGNQPDAELPAGAQDRLSVTLQLAARVAGLGRPLRTGETLDFPVATARATATWRFRYEGTAWLPGPGGHREALHLRRRPEGPHELGIELWLAPDLDYLPLQWRLTQDNGDWLEQRWASDYRP